MAQGHIGRMHVALLIFLLHSIVVLLLVVASVSAQPPLSQQLNKNEQHAFDTIDSLMSTEKYDSAGALLRNLGSSLNFQQADYKTYYYHTRQAEIMYYNNLLQLGMQTARRALLTAQALQDSVLLLDAYNFLGLFCTNLDKYSDALNYFSTGLKYASSTADYKNYLELSRPHHIFGNLGEALSKQKRYGEALQQFEKSLQLATEAGSGRAVAVASLSAAEAWLALGAPDTALALLTSGKEVALAYNDFDICLMAYAYFARTYAAQGKKEQAYKAINDGLSLQKTITSINPYYSLLFINEAAKVYKIFADYIQLSKALEQTMLIERIVRSKNNQQTEQVLAAGLVNENKLLQLEISEARQRQQQSNTKVLLLILLVLLLLVVIAYFRYSSRQQLKLANLRNRLSQNLHDDIGATLSSLHIYGDLALQTFHSKPEKSYTMIMQLVHNSKVLMENMNDIVWSMKPDEKEAMSLATRIKNYGLELLQAKGIDGYYQINEGELDKKLDFEKKRSLLLIAKEAINNIAKYSEASMARVEFKLEGNQLLVSITDDGKGCDLTTPRQGNGVNNMKARVQELGGTWQVTSAPGKGFQILASIPL